MKKKCIFPLALAAIMLQPLLTSAAGFLNRISYTVNYDYSNLTVGTDTLGGVTYATVSYDGLYNSGAPGMPSLPIDYFKFSVPYNATNFTVVASGLRQINQNLDYMVYPCQMPWFTDGSPAPAITLPDTAAYFSGNSYPTQMAWIADEGFLAGENHIVTVAVMPLRYTHSATADVLSKARICNLVLRYDLSDSLAMYPIVRNDSLLREEGYQLTQSMVVNPGKVKDYAPAYTFSPGIDTTGFIQGGIGGDIINGGGYAGGGGPQPLDSIPANGVDTTGLGTGQLLADVKYPYLIVTTPELKHAVRRIAALKRQKGYNVKIVTMDEVMHSSFAYHGDSINGHIAFTDSAGVLRQFLRCYYNLVGTVYVLLAGNVPYRYATIRMSSFSDTIISLPSDLYFADINGDWYNNVYDYQPDLFLGRIIAKTSEQISNYSDKLYRYEINPGNGDHNYLKRAIYSQGYDFIRAGEVFNVMRRMNSVFPNHDILSETHLLNDISSKFPSGDTIISTINNTNYGFISLHHHGFPAGLITYGYRDRQKKDEFRFLWALNNEHVFTGIPNAANEDTSTRNGLNSLTNKWYPSICYSTACSTMPFDVVPGYENISMNFGESFTTGKDYGGPAFMGNTRDGVTPNTASVECSLGIMLNKKIYKIGEANALARASSASSQNDTIGNRYSSMNENLLGDPEFEIWTDIPQYFSNVEVIRTDDTITISNIQSDSTIVAYQKKDKQFKTKMNNSQTIILQDALPNSTIMLYKHNYIPYIAPLKLQNETFEQSQYIIARDVIAGNAVDANRTFGDVIIKNAIEYEIEASGTVTLQDGFQVEKGALFTIYPSSF